MRNADGSEVVHKVVVTDNLKCPRCKSGKLVQRTNSKDNTTFWACNRYPKCKHAISEEEYAEYKKTAEPATVKEPVKKKAATKKKTTTKKSTTKKTATKKTTTKKTTKKKTK